MNKLEGNASTPLPAKKKKIVYKIKNINYKIQK